MQTDDSLEKVPDAGEDRGQKEKRVSEDEKARQHYGYNEHGQTLGDGEGQGDLACCSPRHRKESDTTGQLNHHHHQGYHPCRCINPICLHTYHKRATFST